MPLTRGYKCSKELLCHQARFSPLMFALCRVKAKVFSNPCMISPLLQLSLPHPYHAPFTHPTSLILQQSQQALHRCYCCCLGGIIYQWQPYPTPTLFVPHPCFIIFYNMGLPLTYCIFYLQLIYIF